MQPLTSRTVCFWLKVLPFNTERIETVQATHVDDSILHSTLLLHGTHLRGTHLRGTHPDPPRCCFISVVSSGSVATGLVDVWRQWDVGCMCRMSSVTAASGCGCRAIAALRWIL